MDRICQDWFILHYSQEKNSFGLLFLLASEVFQQKMFNMLSDIVMLSSFNTMLSAGDTMLSADNSALSVNNTILSVDFTLRTLYDVR
jgi:hypothetical protein